MEIKINEHKWLFCEEDAEEGLGLPIRGYTFVEPQGFYAVVDSNKRVWIEESPGYFESPCLRFCMDTIRQHPQSYDLINKLREI